MEIKLGDLAQIVGIAVAVAGGINYVVMRPLGSAIAVLKETILDLKTMIKDTEKSRQKMDLRLARVEESSKSAHHRIDGIETALSKEGKLPCPKSENT